MIAIDIVIHCNCSAWISYLPLSLLLTLRRCVDGICSLLAIKSTVNWKQSIYLDWIPNSKRIRNYSGTDGEGERDRVGETVCRVCDAEWVAQLGCVARTTASTYTRKTIYLCVLHKVSNLVKLILCCQNWFCQHCEPSITEAKKTHNQLRFTFQRLYSCRICVCSVCVLVCVCMSVYVSNDAKLFLPMQSLIALFSYMSCDGS